MTQPPSAAQGPKRFHGYTPVEWMVAGVCALLLFAVTLWLVLWALGA